jgi:hypothetical protein
MFSKGQIIFGICFFVGFVILIALSYKKDRAVIQQNYKGSLWVLVGFIGFILLLLALKSYSF